MGGRGGIQQVATKRETTPRQDGAEEERREGGGEMSVCRWIYN